MESVRYSAVHNRIEAVMVHIDRYWSGGISRLARDAGVSKAAVSRFVSGQANPSFAMVWKLGRALETHLGQPLDLCELVSLDGTYPTPSVCTLCGCRGCQVSRTSAVADALDPHFALIRDGRWSFGSVDVGGEAR